MAFGYNKRRPDPLTLGGLAWEGGLYGERIHVAECLFRLVEGVSALAESVAAVTVTEAGEELAVGHLRQVHHQVFAVVSEEVVNVGGVLTGVEGAEVFVIVVTNRVHEGLLWSLGGGGENASLFSTPKVRGTPDKIRGCAAPRRRKYTKIVQRGVLLEAHSPTEDYGSNENEL